MKLRHTNSDYRANFIRRITPFTVNDEGEQVALYQYMPNMMLIAPSTQWGVEVEYEPVDQRESAGEASPKRQAG